MDCIKCQEFYLKEPFIGDAISSVAVAQKRSFNEVFQDFFAVFHRNDHVEPRLIRG